MEVNHDGVELLPLRLGRADVKRRILHVSRELLAFATRSYGPLGRTTLLQKSARCADALVFTSTSDRYFQHVNVGDCPVANVYFQILRSHLRNHSDAGLFLTILSTSLQLKIQEGVLSEIPHQTIQRGLQLALRWSLEYLDDEDCPVRIPIDWSNRSSVNAIVRGIISTKPASGFRKKDLLETVIPMVVEAFVAMYDHIVQNPSESMPVRFLYQPGLKSISKSQLWKNSVFLDFPWPQGYSLKAITNANLALFNITIDPSRDENSSVDTTMAHSSSKDVFRLEALRSIGDTLHRLGVTALMSQKIVPRYLQMYLAGKGVFVLDRLSINHIHAVHQLSGAVVLGDWQLANVDQSSFGFLSLITTHEICGKKYIQLHQESATAQVSCSDLPAAAFGRSSPVSTIVLTAPDKFAFEELSYTMETALKRLAVLAERPDAVAGAGCMEIHLASLLRKKAELLRLPPTPEKMEKMSARDSRGIRQLRQVVQAFADCLLNVVASLGHCTANNEERESLVEKLRVANLQESKQTELFGWDPSERRAVPVGSYLQPTDSSNGEPLEKQVLYAHVLDSYPAKRDALVLAVECACSIARIASVVKVS